MRLLNAVLERMEYRKLHAVYSRIGRIERSPGSLFKIMVYGYMNGIYSSRKLEQACRRDVNFMYLLGGFPVHDRSIIAQKQYDDHARTFGYRNSFSKTDTDATFMRGRKTFPRFVDPRKHWGWKNMY